MVGRRSIVDTAAGTLPGGKSAGARTMSGTRAAPSKKLILYQAPRSPSISPWSLVTMTTVLSSLPVSRSRPISRDVWSST